MEYNDRSIISREIAEELREPSNMMWSTSSSLLLPIDIDNSESEVVAKRVKDWADYHQTNLRRALIGALDLSNNPGAQVKSALCLQLHYSPTAEFKTCLHVAKGSKLQKVTSFIEDRSTPCGDTVQSQSPLVQKDTVTHGFIVIYIKNHEDKEPLMKFTIVIPLDQELIDETSSENWAEKLGMALFLGSHD
ncbi:hypothetical protein QCA50_005273 [Cerrena zonata]|uniref:Uncharacterized protein n=1 Tax=Cerrena zonata TaxID=2478898 RepID=A0AAW0GQN0_9APHY